MTKYKKDIAEMEFDIQLDQLQTMNVQLKATLLPETAQAPKKVMYGFKFSPRADITKESQQAVKDMIRAGEHLKNYGDFVSGKIASKYTAKKIIEQAGFIARQFSSGSNEEFKEAVESLFIGWDLK